MGGQLDELLASLAARCRVCYYVHGFFWFMHCMVTNDYDDDEFLV